MKPLQRAAFDHHGRSPEERTRRIQAMSKQVYGSEVAYEKADEIRKGVEEGEVWLNDVYQVSVQDRGDFVWVLKDSQVRIPVGFNEGRVMNDESCLGAIQRPRG